MVPRGRATAQEESRHGDDLSEHGASRKYNRNMRRYLWVSHQRTRIFDAHLNRYLLRAFSKHPALPGGQGLEISFPQRRILHDSLDLRSSVVRKLSFRAGSIGYQDGGVDLRWPRIIAEYPSVCVIEWISLSQSTPNFERRLTSQKSTSQYPAGSAARSWPPG